MVESERSQRFEQLHSRTHHAVAAYSLRRATGPADAADVVAETYLVLWRRLDDAPTDDRLLPWLYGVARRVLANQRRGDQRREALTERLTQELATLPGPTHTTDPDPLNRALARVSANDRELLQLTAWEGLDRAELALALGISRATARVRLHRARQRLIHALEQEGVEVPLSAPTEPARRGSATPTTPQEAAP